MMETRFKPKDLCSRMRESGLILSIVVKRHDEGLFEEKILWNFSVHRK